MWFRSAAVITSAIGLMLLVKETYGNWCPTIQPNSGNFSLSDLEGEWFITNQFNSHGSPMKFPPCQIFQFRNITESKTKITSYLPDYFGIIQVKVSGVITRVNSEEPQKLTWNWNYSLSSPETVTVVNFNENSIFLAFCLDSFLIKRTDFVILTRTDVSNGGIFNETTTWLKENFPAVDVQNYYEGCLTSGGINLNSDSTVTVDVESWADEARSRITSFFDDVFKKLRDLPKQQLIDLRR